MSTHAVLILSVVFLFSSIGALEEPSSIYQQMFPPSVNPNANQKEQSTAVQFNLNTLRNAINKNGTFYTKSIEQCISDMYYIAALAGEPYFMEWAKKYDDSRAKEPSGSMRQLPKWYGDFDQCLSIPAQERADLPGHFIKPQYCYVALIRETDPETPRRATVEQTFPAFMNGICLSSNCSEADIPLLISSFIAPQHLKVNPHLTYCQKTSFADEPLPTETIAAIAIFSAVAGLMGVGLLVDMGQRLLTLGKTDDDDEKLPQKVDAKPRPKRTPALIRAIIAFSPWTNLEKLLTIPAASTKIPNFSLINGIRTLSIFWIMLGHLYYYMSEYVHDIYGGLEMAKRLTAQFILAAFFAVDSFLFLAGFLAYWSMSRRLPKTFFKFLISLPYIYFQRWIRIAPAYYALVLVFFGLWRYLHNGPFYYQGEDKLCASNWWANLLFINNFYDVDNKCIGWSWYLAVDMQLFILVPFVIYAFTRVPVRFGWAVAISGIVGHIVSSAIITVEHNVPSNPFEPPGYRARLNITAGDEPKDYAGIYRLYYDPTYTRMAPYFLGVICCHLLVKHQKLMQKAFNNPWIHLIGWPLCFGTILAIIYAPHGTITLDRIDPEWVDAIFNAFARIAWGLILGWIILAAAFNKAGIVGQILSWNVWAITARLSYSAYLLHPLVYLFYAQTQRTAFYLTDITVIFLYCATVVITLMLSTIYSIAFESPVMNLLR